MNKSINSKTNILISGANGMVGRSLLNILQKQGFSNIVCPTSEEVDFTKFDDVLNCFQKIKPEIVFNLAAKVGGILDNKNFPADFYFSNIQIGANTYECAAKVGVKKIISLGAGCGYPLNAKEPLKEASIFDGIAQQESIPYSSAKKMLIVQAYAYETQHDIQSTVFIPSNLYGKFDNFNLEKSHVVPALIHKFYSATKNNTKEVEIWGDGSAKRDFIYTDDVSRLMIKAAIEFNGTNVINLASGKQTSIKDLAENCYRSAR